MVEQALAHSASVVEWWSCLDSAFNAAEMLDCYMAHHLESVDIVLEYFDCAAGLFV
jgi:hypothetical protein